jgi:LmbE family N-acetylglucosaminyl deacetylase
MLGKSGNRKALVIVAHCDDAVLWMGGTIHRLRDWEWHIFTLCDGNGGKRKQSFYESCEMLRAKKSHAFSFQDYLTGGAFSRNNEEEMKRRLMKRIDEAYDFVFSHGLQEWNEYGHHDNHEEVGIVATRIAEEKSWSLIRFCYRPIYCSSGIATVADNKRADYYSQLNYEELRFKLKMIEDCFQHEMVNLSGLAYPCPNPEAFKGDSLPEPFIKSSFACMH